MEWLESGWEMGLEKVQGLAASHRFQTILHRRKQKG